MKQLTVRKRHLIGAAILGLTGTMLGCTAEGGDEDVAATYGESSLTEADNEGQIRLAVDRVLALKLPGKLSAGKGWTFEAIDTDVVRVVDDDVDPGDELGGIDTQIVRLVGVKKGSTVLKLKYGRPWENATEKTYSVKVDVDGGFIGNFVPPSVKVAAAMNVGEPRVGVPTQYSSCDQGACTPVKDQGGCGSCWAFATAGTIESAIALKDKVSRDVSEQYLVSCNLNGMSCNGGGPAFSTFIDQIRSEGDTGVVYESDFPYTATNGSCQGPYQHHEKMKSWKTIPSDVDSIKQAILDNGAVYAHVCVNGPFFEYRSGIFDGQCSDINHGVVLVGFDDNGGNGYWILRNSWGPGWGENGYMKIRYGANMVGVYAATVEYDGSAPNNDDNNTTDTCPVELFADPNFTGASTCLDPGMFDIDKLFSTIGNDTLSSVRVKPGYRAILFEHARFEGSIKELTSDASFLPDFNDVTSAVGVVRQ